MSLKEYQDYLIKYNLSLKLHNGSLSIEGLQNNPLSNASQVKKAIGKLKLEKQSVLNELIDIEMQRLVTESVSRVNQFKGWNNVDASKLKVTDPVLYNEWLKSEYQCDELYGQRDIEGLTAALAHYEIISFKVVSKN